MKENIRRKDGTWKQYHKRSISEVPPFVGWDKLLFIVDTCNQIDYDIYYRDYCIERDKALVATLFSTGARIGELLVLERSNFDFTPKDYCVVSNMLLEKRYEKIGSYIETVTQEPTGAFAKLYEPMLLNDGSQIWKRKRWRTTITSDKVKELRIRKPFPILKNEPLYPILEAWVQRNHSELLFPSPKMRKNGVRTMSITNAWIIIHRLEKLTGISMWNHWFRSQRASQMKKEYGFTIDDRKDWFGWRTDPMASDYPKTSAEEMANKMMVKATVPTLNIARI